MKALPLLVLILNFLYVLCQETIELHKPLLKYPKKTKPSVKNNVQILLSRKFVNSNPVLKKKIPLSSNSYTAFPVLGFNEKAIYDVPDSPIFPMDHKDDQKTRVKKILSDDLIASFRKKRSAISVNSKNQTDHKSVKKVTNHVKGHHDHAHKTKRHNNKDHNGHHKLQKRKNNSTNQKKVARQRLNGSSKRTKLNKNSKKLRSKNLKSRKPKRMGRSNDKSVKKPHKDRNAHNLTKTKKVTLKDKDSRRLIAARDATIEDYPYMVSIQKDNEHWCAGALLNPRMVITTANCVWKSQRVSRLKVRVGSRHADRGGQLFNIEEVMKHPNWNIRKNPDNDVALLRLDRRVKFSDKVHGVDLPNRIMMPPFEDAWVTSWGAERRDGVVDKKAITLQVIHARVMDREKCNNITHRFGVTVTPNFICLSQSGKRAPCTRDTGAPAVSDGVIWGLASWGIRRLCGTDRFPAMFSYLASHTNMDFISNATRYLMSDERFYPALDRFRGMDQQPDTSPPNISGQDFRSKLYG